MSGAQANGSKPASRKLAVVVGAGVAGCQAARALLRAGYDALVLEQGRGLGGVWRRNYHSFGLQVPWCCYTFPEFPYDKAPKELGQRAREEGYPSGETVKDYIAAYCAHFDLERHVLYGAKVVHLGVLPGNRWSVRFRHAASPGQSPQAGALKVMEADLVVMATGMYYSPYVPSVPGLASFKGTVLHARDFVSVERLQGKRVLVLGAGKSATDCAVVAASPAAGAASVTTLFRQAHWPLPREIFGLPFHRVVYTRFTAAMLPMYYTGQDRAAKRLKHQLLSPLKHLFWRTLESHVARKFNLRGALRPELRFVQDVFFGGQIQDGSWNDAINAGRISAVQGSLAEVRPGGVRLQDGTVIECDIIIFATGYTKDYSLFDAATAGRLMAAAGSPGTEAGLNLYRSIMSPWVPNLYFIGCEASSFNNVLTSGLQSLWMTHHLMGHLQLPAAQELMRDIQKQRVWRKSVMPPQNYCASSIMLYQQRYHDQLVRDMGNTPKRKRERRRGGSEVFGVYTSEDYADLFDDAAVPGLAAAAAAAPPARSAEAVVAAAVMLMPAAAAIGARLDLAVMPAAAGGGAGGGDRASAGNGGAAAGPRRAALVPVCTEHSDAVAIAVAPGETAGTASANTGSGMGFIRSFDSPAKARDGRGTPGANPAGALGAGPGAGGEGGAAQPVLKVVSPAAAVPAAAELSKEDGECGATAAAAAAAGAAATDAVPVAASATLGVLDTAITEGCCRSSAGPTGPVATSALSNALASGSVSVADVNAAAAIHSALSTNTALAATSVAGSRATAPPPATSGGSQTPRRMTLAHRVRLQVLHLVQRNSRSELQMGAATAPQTADGAAAGVEDVLEFRLASNATLSGRVADSLMMTGTAGVAASLGTAGGGGGAAAAANSSTLCCDNLRHAAPNVYNELVGTLEVH